jgi:hypothetical protein
MDTEDLQPTLEDRGAKLPTEKRVSGERAKTYIDSYKDFVQLLFRLNSSNEEEKRKVVVGFLGELIIFTNPNARIATYDDNIRVRKLMIKCMDLRICSDCLFVRAYAGISNLMEDLGSSMSRGIPMSHLVSGADSQNVEHIVKEKRTYLRPRFSKTGKPSNLSNDGSQEYQKL